MSSLKNGMPRFIVDIRTRCNADAVSYTHLDVYKRQVHNSREVERLKAMGLITINHEEFNRLHNAKVLLRAHGERCV